MKITIITTTLMIMVLPACSKKESAPPVVGSGSGSGSGSGAGSGSGSGAGGGAAGWAELLGVQRTGAASGSMLDVIKGFPGYERCLERLQRSLPPDLGADVLPYYDLPDYLCRTREAISKADPSVCTRVVSYALKKSCTLMVGMYSKKPELCPADYPTRMGKSGYCLAMAQRDPSLCFGAKSEEEEARCKAILWGDDGHCGELSRTERREACKSEVARWAPVVRGDAKASQPKDYRPSFELTSIKTTNAARPAPFEKVTLSCASQGAVVPSYGDTAKVILCSLYPYGYRVSKAGYTSNEYKTKVAFEFRPPASDTAKVSFGTDAFLQLQITGLDAYTGAQSGEIAFEKFERRRGGQVKGSFKVTIEQGLEKLTVEGRFDSFVRDLVSPTDLAAGARYGYGYGSSGGAYGSSSGAGVLGGLGSSSGGAGVLGGLGTASSGSSGGLGIGGRYGAGYGARVAKRYAGVLTSATLTAESPGGRVIGYRITNIQAGSLWERLGVRGNDLVLQVGARPLLTMQDVINVRTEVQNAVTLKIRVKRGARAQVITVNKVAMQKIKDDFYF